MGKFILLKRSDKTQEHPAKQRPESQTDEKPARQQIEKFDLVTIKFCARQMRSFYRAAKKVEKMPDSPEKTHRTNKLIEKSRELVLDLGCDQREKLGSEKANSIRRADFEAYFDERRELMNLQMLKWHWGALNVAAGIITAMRKGADAGWTFVAANFIQLAEFVVRNLRLNSLQTQAERGWKMVQEYAQKEKAAEAVRQAVKTTAAAEQKAEKQPDKLAQHTGILPEYAD